MLTSLKIHTKTPNTQDFHHKNSQLEHFSCRIHQKLGIFDEIFPKNWETHIIWYKINHKSNNLGRKLRKIRFFTKTGTNFSHITSTNNFIWVHISTIAKTIVFPHKTKVEISPKSNLTKISTNYCRKHRKFAKFVNLHNRIQHSEKFSPIISKLAFSQVPQQLFYKQA